MNQNIYIYIYKNSEKVVFGSFFWVFKKVRWKVAIYFYQLSFDFEQWNKLFLEVLSFVFKRYPFQVGLQGEYFFILSQQNEKVDFSKCRRFLALHKQKFRYPKSIWNSLSPFPAFSPGWGECPAPILNIMHHLYCPFCYSNLFSALQFSCLPKMNFSQQHCVLPTTWLYQSCLQSCLLVFLFFSTRLIQMTKRE